MADRRGAGIAAGDLIEVRGLLPAPPQTVAELFWDICAWQAIWDRIEVVDVRYDDGLHQEFSMTVERDGHSEQVRTIRLRPGPDTDIAFFSPAPPPAMTWHRGLWAFRQATNGPAATEVLARREYALRPGRQEDAVAFAHRSSNYREGFRLRLGQILRCFGHHFAALGEPATPGDET